MTTCNLLFWRASQCKYEIYLILCCGKWAEYFSMFFVWNGNSNKRAENWAKIDLRMLLWAEKMAHVLKWAVNAMSSCTSAATLAPLSMSLPCHRPCHRPRQFTRHHCYPCHRQVNSHVILHVINVWHGNRICDENYTVRDVNFRHRKRAWVGLQGARRYSMTVLKRHGSSNLWQKFKERHEVWSVTLNTWRYLRSS